jgi:chitinase
MFATTAVNLMKDLGFDGIDIDWEYPQDATQAHNYVLLLEETRRAIDAYSLAHNNGKRMLLTVAVPAGPSNYQKLQISQMDQYLDFWNLMAYDFAGSWDTISGHQANIFPSTSNPSSTPFSADAAIKAYCAGGVAPHKIVLGMPLYGRAFENTNDPGTSFTGVGDGSWENGVWDYKALPQPGAREVNDNTLLAAYSYDPARRKMISYDTPEIQAMKCEYIKSCGLGGGMWWELSGDHPVSDPRSLVATTVRSLGGVAALEQEENTINYPASRYDNMRAGFPGEHSIIGEGAAGGF